MNSLEFLTTIWLGQNTKGFGCISFFIKATSTWKNYYLHVDPEYSQIDKLNLIMESKEISQHSMYFTPTLFKYKSRRKAFAQNGHFVFADIDRDIQLSEFLVPPHFLWETSPGRFQAIWRMVENLTPDELENLNKRLAYGLAADKSGWDVTQLLRVPGSINHKYDHKPEVKLHLSQNGTLFTIAIKDVYPLPCINTLGENKTEFLDLLMAYSTQISPTAKQLLEYPMDKINGLDRSGTLWRLENDLIQSHIPLEDVVRIIQLSPWNKYKGRHDEKERLHTEITKAYHKQTELEVVRPKTILPWKSFGELMSLMDAQQSWLIQDIWGKASHGIIGGEPKTYKSTICLDLALSVASGIPLWGKFEVASKGPVIMIQNENPEWLMRNRVERILESKNLGGKITQDEKNSLIVEFLKDLPMYFLSNSGFNLSLEKHQQELEQLIEQEQPKLVVLDPLYLMFSGDINSAKELFPLLSYLIALKDKHQFSLILVHHWGKKSLSTRGGQKLLGSTTLHGWTDSAIYLQEREEGIIMEREFRSSPPLEPLLLSLAEDENYRVEVKEYQASEEVKVMDEIYQLLGNAPEGLLVNELSVEFSIQTRKLKRLIESHNNLSVVGKGKALRVMRKGG